MAEVGYIFPEDAAKQVVEVGNAIKATDDKLLKYTEDASKLIALLKQQNISFEQLQKVQKEAVDTTTKLDAVGKQLLQSEEKLKQVADKRTEQIIKNRTETTKLTQALKDKLKANQAEEGSLVRMRAKLKELTEQYDRTGNRTKAATAEINKLSKEIQKAEFATNRHQRNVGNYASSIQGLTGKFLGALGITSAIFIFANALKNTFSKIKEFSKESAVLAGVLGKTRREITQLTEQAVQLGSIYPITATEVNKLQVSYARLGFTQSEIMQLTEATIQGAMALNSELDATATLVGAVVKAYDSLKTSDAPDIVDKLTVSTQKSSLSFSSLETALPKVAGAANAMNIPLEKTLALLGIAQDATLDASISGTSLRNIFLELSARGITLNEALTQINSSQNKLNEAYDLFGKRGAIVGLALANNIEKTAELENEISKAGGTAERVAKEQMATLDGSVSGMASSWEKLMLSFRNSEGVLKTMVGWFAKSFDAISNMIDAQNNKNISFLNKSLLWFKGNSQQAIETALKQSLSKANRADVEFTIKNNKEKLKEGSKYEKNLLQLMYNRLDEIKKAEEKAAKESIALKEKEVNEKALQELEKLKPQKLSKEDKAAAAKAKKEAEDRAKFDRAILDSEEKLAREELSIWAEEINQRYELNLKKIELEKSVNDTIAQIREDARKTEEEKADEESDKILARIKKINEDEKKQKEETNKQIFDGGVTLANTLFDLKSSQLQREFQMAEGNEQKQKEISAKIAKTEKNKALFDIAINTAVAITKALPNLVLAGIAGAIGLVQAGIVAAKPIPKFATGTDFAPREFIAGEKGREIVQTKSGDVVMADKATHFKGNRFKGATVYTNRETEQIIEQSGRGNNFIFDTREIKDGLKSVENAINRKPIAITDNSGRVIGKQSNNYRETYLNRMQNGR